jgi:hypothetical protein
MAFAGHVAAHMKNDDHMEATIAMVEQYVPGFLAGRNKYVQAAEITSIRDPESEDQLLGQPKELKLRLPFLRAVTERKDAESVIIEMTQVSSAASNQRGRKA